MQAKHVFEVFTFRFRFRRWSIIDGAPLKRGLSIDQALSRIRDVPEWCPVRALLQDFQIFSSPQDSSSDCWQAVGPVRWIRISVSSANATASNGSIANMLLDSALLFVQWTTIASCGIIVIIVKTTQGQTCRTNA